MHSIKPQQNTNLHDDPQAWAASLVRPLSRRYLLLLVAVAALVIVDQAIIQPLLVNLNFYAPVINLAGRQRMLSQKVTKEALALASTNTDQDGAYHRQELLQAIDQWTSAHRALLYGDPQLGLQPVESPAIAAALLEIEPRLEAIAAAAAEIAGGGPDDRDTELRTRDTSHPLTVILGDEPLFLLGMERVVALLEQSAGRQIAWLRWCGLIAMALVLALLLGVYLFVLLPANGLIGGQVQQLAASDARHHTLAAMLREARDELEQRVSQRTRELTVTNDALEREMAERQAAEERMRALSTQLAHASRVTALGQLATGLAHEINQPLGSIANYAETLDLLLERNLSIAEPARQVVLQVKHAALRAGAIVRRMRNFVRPGATGATLVELNDLAREVFELCRPELQKASVELVVDLTSLPTSVFADPLQVQQVLINLVQNAIGAMEARRRAERHLQISTSIRAAEVRIEVADSGPGFPESADAFAPFYSTKPDGLGMGLAISRSIIEQHQGRIWAGNRPQGGAVVTFSLPLSNPQHHADREQQSHCLCG